MARLSVLALVCFPLTGIALAQETRAAPMASSEIKRAHFVVRNADPSILAEIVGKHFSGEAFLVAPPAGSGNVILISGSQAKVGEVVKLLEQLDRKPRSVEVELILLDVPVPKDGKDIETGGDITGKLVDLIKSGTSQRIKVTAVEGRPVSSTTGGDRPITTRVAGGAAERFGARTSSVMYRPLGTSVKLTARVMSDEGVAVDLNLDESKTRPADPADEAGAPSFDKSTLTTTLNIPAGKAVVAEAVRNDGKTSGTLSLVIVTARVVPETRERQAK